VRFLILLVLYLSADVLCAQDANCIPARTVVQLPGVFSDMNANYLRVSPDGKYVLVTLSRDRVVLFEITERNGRTVATRYATPLRGEAYPSPDWQYIASPYHDGHTRFYKLDDLISLQRRAPSALNDTFTEFYNSLGGDKDNFRMVAWNYLASRTYTSRNGTLQAGDDVEIMCPNLVNLTPEAQRIAAWWVRRAGHVHPRMETSYGAVHRLLARDREYQNLCQPADPGAQLPAQAEIERRTRDCDRLFSVAVEKYLRQNQQRLEFTDEDIELQVLKLRLAKTDVPAASRAIILNPIISPSGNEIAGIYNGTTRIFTINTDRTCTETANLGVRTSKISFSPSTENGHSRYIVYTDQYLDNASNTMNSGTFLRDLERKTDYLLSDRSMSYPNLTRDGRVYSLEDNKLLIVDPHQITRGNVYPSCVPRRRSQGAQRGDSTNQ
jgi:hypothetical protein